MKMSIRLRVSALIALLSSRMYMIVEEDDETTLRLLSRDTNALKSRSLPGHRFETASMRSTCDPKLAQQLLLNSENARKYAEKVG